MVRIFRIAKVLLYILAALVGIIVIFDFCIYILGPKNSLSYPTNTSFNLYYLTTECEKTKKIFENEYFKFSFLVNCRSGGDNCEIAISHKIFSHKFDKQSITAVNPGLDEIVIYDYGKVADLNSPESNLWEDSTTTIEQMRLDKLLFRSEVPRRIQGIIRSSKGDVVLTPELLAWRAALNASGCNFTGRVKNITLKNGIKAVLCRNCTWRWGFISPNFNYSELRSDVHPGHIFNKNWFDDNLTPSLKIVFLVSPQGRLYEISTLDTYGFNGQGIELMRPAIGRDYKDIDCQFWEILNSFEFKTSSAAVSRAGSQTQNRK